jgi:hypothetical protein
MPFSSKAQARYLFANHPDIAIEWADKTKSFKKLPDKLHPHKEDKPKEKNKMNKTALEHAVQWRMEKRANYNYNPSLPNGVDMLNFYSNSSKARQTAPQDFMKMQTPAVQANIQGTGRTPPPNASQLNVPKPEATATPNMGDYLNSANNNPAKWGSVAPAKLGVK